MLKVEPFTYADLQAFPEDGKRREIISGELFVAASPNTIHQRISVALSSLIWLHLETHPQGEIFEAPTDLLLSNEDIVVPDIMVVLAQSQARITRRGVEGAPDWLVEIISPSSNTYDSETKRKLYARYGVQLYWLIDPATEELRVWEGETLSVYGAEDTVNVSLLPGFELKLSRIFRRR